MQLPKPGDTFENYQIIKILGKIRHDQLFLAVDLKSNRNVAIQFLDNRGQNSESSDTESFKSYGQILMSLQHPNIPAFYNFGNVGDLNFLVMEFIEGETLLNSLDQGGSSITDSVAIVTQVLSGLELAHANGILHGGLHPANVLLAPKDEVKIVGFGMPNNLGSAASDHETSHYFAQEVLRGASPSQSSDLFSVGMILLEMLANVSPCLDDSGSRAIKTPADLPLEVTKLLPAGLQEVLEKMIMPEGNQRYQSATEVLQDIKKANSPTEGPTKDPAERPQEDPTEDAVLPDFLGASLAPQASEEKKSKKPRQTKSKGRKSKKIDGIPFPLFRPPYSLSVIFLLGAGITFTFLNSTSIKKELEKKTWTVNIIYSLFSSPEEKTESSEGETDSTLMGKAGESLKDMSKSLQRKISSTRKAELAHPSPRSWFRFRHSKSSLRSGLTLENDEYLLKILSVKNGYTLAMQKRDEGDQWTNLYLSPNAAVPPLRRHNESGLDAKIVLSGNYNELYPLEIGKKNQFSINQLKANGTFHQKNRACEVLDYKSLSVVNQKMPVFVIECTTSDERTNSKSRLYYSPDLKLVVKKEIKVTGNGDQIEEKLDLLQYETKGAVPNQ